MVGFSVEPHNGPPGQKERTMCAGNDREKDSRVGDRQCWQTRNGSLVVTSASSEGIIGTVIDSKDEAFPVGTKATYVNNMGHVLCEGNDDKEQDQCQLHPLDAETKREVTMDLVMRMVAAVAEKTKLKVARRFVADAVPA
jgi:hypothetical protein